MTPRALAFNSTQIAELKRAAALLPPEGRDAFLRQVAGRLSATPTNGDVQAAILAVLSDANVRVSTPMFCCDEEPHHHGTNV